MIVLVLSSALLLATPAPLDVLAGAERALLERPDPERAEAYCAAARAAGSAPRVRRTLRALAGRGPEAEAARAHVADGVLGLLVAGGMHAEVVAAVPDPVGLVREALAALERDERELRALTTRAEEGLRVLGDSRRPSPLEQLERRRRTLQARASLHALALEAVGRSEDAALLRELVGPGPAGAPDPTRDRFLRALEPRAGASAPADGEGS